MSSRNRRLSALLGAATVATLLSGACSAKTENTTTAGSTPGAPAGNANVSGKISVSGSSTVEPISTRVAEEFEATNKDVQITVDGPGTGDGFKVFCTGETDISDASRPIKKEEVEACTKSGIEFIELKVAIDGLTVMTSPENTTVECLNLNDLYAIVGGESKGFKNWTDAGKLAKELGSSTTFPDAPLDITAPGTESGTYDSFYELALQKTAEKRAKEGKLEADAKGLPKDKFRADYTSQANDNAILQAIEGSKSPFGWVGFAYAEEAGDKIREIKVDGGKGCVAPTPETIANNSYPLSRSLYIYVNKKKLDSNPAIKPFVDFYVGAGLAQVKAAGYVPLAAAEVEATGKVWAAKTVGTRDGGK